MRSNFHPQLEPKPAVNRLIDVNDLAAMEMAGLCACPSNAAAEVLAHVAKHGYVSLLPGGHGAVRSFADAILAARNLRGQDVFQLRPPE